LSQITAPTLIIHGAESVISVEGANAIVDRISDAQLIVFENVGHFPHIEASQEFKAAVKAFLK
jgi:pimeloyl-ACP methyl ester carboxylesterase